MSDEEHAHPEAPYPEQPAIPDPSANDRKVYRGTSAELFQRVGYSSFGKAGPAAPIDDRPSPGYGFECGCCNPEFDIGSATVGQQIGDAFEVFTDWRTVLGIAAAGLVVAGLGAGFGALGGAVSQNAGGGAPGAFGGGLVATVVGMLAGTLAGAAGGSDTATAVGLGLGGVGLITGLTGAIAGGGASSAADAARTGAIAGAIAGAAVGVVGGMVAYSFAKQKATKELARIAPSWTYALNTKRTNANRAMANFRFAAVSEEVEMEVEGEMAHSFQTWTDVPVYQFHQYFDWNFYIKPREGYRHAASWASVYLPENAPADAPPPVPEMECEWDTGSFSGPPGQAGTSDADLVGASPTVEAAMFRDVDLAWPMTGQPVWAAGRWVFDCGHGNPVTGREDRDVTSQRMRLELHPVKAVASARFEGVRFSENQDLYVPGVRFMFFASAFGGYYKLPHVGQKDYTFIVDLPLHTDHARLTFSVEDHPAFPDCKVLVGASNTSHDTLAPGQRTPVASRGTRLLIRIDTAPYELTMRGRKSSIHPKIEPVYAADGTLVNNQMKVTIPLTGDTSAEAYGVIIELGWRDNQDFTEAQKVKRYAVTFHEARKLATYDHNTPGDIPLALADVFTEEWRLRFGVNGRWAQTAMTEVSRKGGPISLADKLFVVHLRPEDPLSINCHGTEHDSVEDIFEEPRDRRTAKIDDRTLTYDEIFRCTDDAQRRQVTRALYAIQWRSFADTSDPLGRYELKSPASQHAVGRFSYAARALKEDHRLAHTVEEPPGTNDYTLTYTIQVEDQRLPRAGATGST